MADIVIVYLLFIYLFVLLVKILDPPPSQYTRTLKHDATEDITQHFIWGWEQEAFLEMIFCLVRTFWLAPLQINHYICFQLLRMMILATTYNLIKKKKQ